MAIKKARTIGPRRGHKQKQQRAGIIAAYVNSLNFLN